MQSFSRLILTSWRICFFLCAVLNSIKTSIWHHLLCRGTTIKNTITRKILLEKYYYTSNKKISVYVIYEIQIYINEKIFQTHIIPFFRKHRIDKNVTLKIARKTPPEITLRVKNLCKLHWEWCFQRNNFWTRIRWWKSWSIE